MIHRSIQRRGVTLMEVLIATGILAIGMLALLALFPIGAISMARAINQNRAADQGANSDAMFRYYWKKAWLDQNGGLRPLDTAPLGFGLNAIEHEPAILLLDRSPSNLATRLIPTSSSQPGYCVLIDPIGYRTQPPGNQTFVGGLPFVTVSPPGPPPVMPARGSLASCVDIRSTVRLTTLLDDMTFDTNGEPSGATGQLERGGRYSVSWLIRRERSNVPHEVNLHVLVFAGRSPTDTPSAEQVFTAYADNYVPNVDPKPTLITVDLGGQPKPPIKKGGWLAFATPILPPGGVAVQAFDFYRVAAVTDDFANDRLLVEVEQPLRTYETATLSFYNGATTRLNGYVVVFDNLIEVLDRGMVSATATSGR